jgi:hypothetical protein
MEAIAKSVTQTQVVRCKKLFLEREVPPTSLDEAIKTALLMVLEHHRRPHMIKICKDASDVVTLLASYFPPPGAQPDKTVIDIVTEAVSIFAPLRHKAPGGDTARESGQDIVVQTYEEKEKAERFIKVGPYKFPRRSEQPWDCIYPHHWITLTASQGPVVAHEAWNRQLNLLFAGLTIIEHQRPRHRHLLAQITIWFTLIGEKPQVDTTAPHLIRLWFHFLEQILELMLMSGVRLAGSFTTATTKFHSVCQQRWNNAEPLDYYKAINDAKEAKDSPGSAQTTPSTKNSFRRVL